MSEVTTGGDGSVSQSLKPLYCQR